MYRKTIPTPLRFKSWWQALSAVPPRRAARDWWAQEDLERSSRYNRLCCVWGDPTDRGGPPYYYVHKEKHLVSTLWENFAIFHPSDTVDAIYRELKFEAPSQATDLCWSYEFSLGHQERHLDIVMHVRFDERDEIVIGEAKAGRTPFDSKDKKPSDVLSRDVFGFTEVRHYFLLGDASPPVGWQQNYGYLTWKRLYELQVALCEKLPEPSSVQELIKRLIRAQFAGHSIVIDTLDSDNSITSLQAEASSRLADVTTEYCRDFIVCAIQHVRCLQGLQVDSVPFAYLSSEPLFEDIKPNWRPGYGNREVSEEAYWKLPPDKKDHQ